MLAVAVAAAMVSAAAAVSPTPFPRPLVETVGDPPSWTVLLGTFSGAEENPPRDSPGTGTAVGMVWGRSLRLRWSFSGLATPVDPAAGIHVHAAAAGVNSPAIVVDLLSLTTLSAGGTAGRGNVTITLTADGLRAATAAGLYLNVHTEGLSAGELRTQLWPVRAEDLAKTGQLMSAATAAVVEAGRREAGGGKTSAAAVGIAAGVVVAGAALAGAAWALRRRQNRPHAARGREATPRTVTDAVAAAAGGAAAAAAGGAAAAAAGGAAAPPVVGAQDKPRGRPRGEAPPAGAASASDDEWDDHTVPLSPDVAAPPRAGPAAGHGRRALDSMRRTISSFV